MKKFLKQCADATLARSPAQLYFQGRAAQRLTILAYHGIDHPEVFARQLDFLIQTMQPVTLETVLDALRGRRDLPPRAVLLTFDDGERSLLEHGIPLLQERNMPGVVFVVAGLLDTAQPFWWIEVEALARNGGRTRAFQELDPVKLVQALKKVSNEQRLAVLEELRRTAAAPAPPMTQLRRCELSSLARAGMAVGNHTLTHPCLHQCTGEAITKEIGQAHAILTEVLGRAPRVFAYPNGDVDGQAIQTLRELEYEAAFLYDHRVSAPTPPDRFRISRVRVNSHTGLDRFRILVSGLHSALHYMQGKA